MVTMDRRRFLKTAAATVPLVRSGDSFVLAQSAATAGADSSASHQASADLPWQKTLRRIGQTNFTEHDPAVFDIEGWANYWSSAKVGAVFISITGIKACD